MDDLMARTMVENLSIGIDPLTGRALPPSDCCANELVQEALKTVLEHCSLKSYTSMLERQRQKKRTKKAERKEQRKEQYPNSGKIWTSEEETLLRNLYTRSGKSIGQIATILNRTPAGVKSHLNKLGFPVR